MKSSLSPSQRKRRPTMTRRRAEASYFGAGPLNAEWQAMQFSTTALYFS